MPSASRAPSKSWLSLPRAANPFSVGKPLTLNFAHSALFVASSQSTAPSLALSPTSFFSAFAALVHSGASFLQWPHHGA